MKVTITGRKINPRDSFKDQVELKMKKIERFFGDDAQAFVTVTLERSRKTVEVTVKNKNMLYRAEETTDNDPEDAFNNAIDTIIRKIRRNKTKVEKRLRDHAFDGYVPGGDHEEDYRVVRTKIFSVKPMSAEEAILQMNMLGLEFFMFRNDADGRINVVYTRKDGDYGLIEPDN